MAWEKSSSDLVKLFAEITPRAPNIQHKMIFGYAGAFVNRYLFTALFRQSMIFRLSVNDQAAFLDQPGTAPFEPVPGRKMSGFVLLRDPLAATEEEISDWMQCALAFASGLPPKKTTKKKTVRKKAS